MLIRTGNAVMTAVLCAWSVAIGEGLVLQWTGDGRSPADWVYALFLYGCFGVAVAGLLRILSWPLERRRPGLLEAALPPVLVFGLSLVVGGMWLNQWARMPAFGSRSGILINAAALALGVAVTLLLVRRRWRRRQGARTSAVRGGTGLFLLAALLGEGIFVAGSSLLPPARAAPPDDAPPVIVLVIDTLRRDHLGCYGYARKTSPHIDALASGAIVFDAATTSGNFTLPSVTCLFTGLYPTQHGVTKPRHRIGSGHAMLAEAFRAAGYRTAAFVANPILRPAMGFSRGFDSYHPSPPPAWIRGRTTALERAAARLGESIEDGRADDLVPRAIDWLQGAAERPPFLYLHLLEPHSPYAPPSTYAGHFLAGPDSTLSMGPPNIWKYRTDGKWANFEDVVTPPVVDDETRSRMMALYDGEIRWVDEWVGNFLDGLRSMGLYDDSLIVLLADHGEEFDDHGGWFHGLTLYEEMVGMPLILKLPGGQLAGSRSGLSLDMVDLAATLSSIAGLEPRWRGGGRNYGESLRDGPAAEQPGRSPSAFVERPPYLYGLRLGPWKLIRRVRGGIPDDRLFDLLDDPRESVDLAADQPDTLLMMQLRLESVLRSLGRARRHERGPEVDPETLRALRALGYIE